MRSFRMAMFNFNKPVRRPAPGGAWPAVTVGEWGLIGFRVVETYRSERDLSMDVRTRGWRSRSSRRAAWSRCGKLLSDVKLSIAPQVADESSAGQTASVSQEAELAPHEKKIFAILKADESTYIDEIVEPLEPELSKIFAAPFEHELAGNVRRLSERIS